MTSRCHKPGHPDSRRRPYTRGARMMQPYNGYYNALKCQAVGTYNKPAFGSLIFPGNASNAASTLAPDVRQGDQNCVEGGSIFGRVNDREPPTSSSAFALSSRSLVWQSAAAPTIRCLESRIPAQIASDRFLRSFKGKLRGFR